MPVIDVVFPVLGTDVPSDHAYLLYSALTRLVPAFHEPKPVFFAPISGQPADKGVLRLYERSWFRCRLPAESTPLVLPLAGKPLVLGQHRIRLGVPRVAALIPSPNLAARIVTFKHSTDTERFGEVAREKLELLGIRGTLTIPDIASGHRQGEPRRKVIRIKGKRVIGYALHVSDLTAEESMRLQEQGLGGTRRMGCGFFVPIVVKGERS